MAGNLTSTETNVLGMDYALIKIVWTGSSPVGEIQVEALRDRKDNIETWATVDFGSTISVSGNSGSHDLVLTRLPFEKTRVKYVRTSGTGTLNAIITVKEA
jgi:hypothetical protein